MESDSSRAFSPSKLGAYKDCPRRYRYRYVDKIRRAEQSIEAYLGSCAHRALEELYAAAQNGRVLSEAELLDFFSAAWEKGWSPNIVIRDARYGRQEWKTVGQDALSLYHKTHAPFNQERTVGLEKRIGFLLKTGDGAFRIEGFIDRLALGLDGAYEIHDYKTGRTIPSQEELDSDWQLAVYDAAVRETWPDTKTVRLIWHYLRYGKTLVSKRSPQDIEALKSDITQLIGVIKSDHEFAPKESPLCGWCEYRDICPLWAHAETLAKLPEPQRSQDDGARLVDALADLEERRKILRGEINALENEESALKGKISEFAQERGLSAVFGTRAEAAVSEKGEYKFPTKTHAAEAFAALENELKSGPLWREASHFDAHRFLESLKSGAWTAETRLLAEGVLSRYATLARERFVRLKRRKDDSED